MPQLHDPAVRTRMQSRVRALILAGAALLTACVGEKSKAEIDAADAAARAARGGARATGAAPTATSLAAVPDSLQLLVALDDSVKRLPSDPRVAAWLYEAGVEGTRFAFYQVSTAEDSAAMAAMPEAFFLNEIAGSHTYTGWHLTQLVGRFPTDSLADDAAFLLAQHHDFVAGECEGFFFCYLAASVGPYTRFLVAMPWTPFAPAAIAAVDSALRADFNNLETGQFTFQAVDPTVADTAQQRHQVVSVDATLRGWEGAVRGLPSPYRERGEELLVSIKERWQRAKGAP